MRAPERAPDAKEAEALVELVNSSIEAIVDRISMERHPLSGHAKDAGSPAVLMACVIAAILWAAILLPVHWPR